MNSVKSDPMLLHEYGTVEKEELQAGILEMVTDDD